LEDARGGCRTPEPLIEYGADAALYFAGRKRMANEVTEAELARARKWFIKEASKKYDTSLTSEDLDEWAAYFALYARQEREAERERIAANTQKLAEQCSPNRGVEEAVLRTGLIQLADRIRKGEL
jgi:hypothetical protein